MPPHHLILVFLCIVGLPTVLTFFSLLHSHPRGQIATESTSDTPKSGLRALFSFHTPSTLFPPSAIISLTDDNSTFFLARPADFGPSLSGNGLSGQLWIGSGFGDDNLGRGGPGAGAEGELGCSDVPGWEGGVQQHRRDTSADQTSVAHSGDEANAAQQKNGGGSPLEVVSDDAEEPSEADGTDDHLHHPLPSSPVSKPSGPGRPAQHQAAQVGQPSTHADIQSLQESAEISGKIVLLSRGGCGFLEKVKWAQRRGGSALIVGDHTRGGALVTMYARGDTSNVTIPSLFTSHTTAHLLSSLIPPESPVDESESEDTITGPESSAGAKKAGSKTRVDVDGPTFTPASGPKSTSTPSRSSKGKNAKSSGKNGKLQPKEKPSWLRSLASSLGMGRENYAPGTLEDSRRPPSSGRLDWFSEKLTDESPKEKATNSKEKNGKAKGQSKSEPFGKVTKDTKKYSSHPGSSDDFVIGVQDWRDPDLVAAKPSAKTKSTTTTRASAATPVPSKGSGKAGESADEKPGSALTGGSITPGSGQYNKPGNKAGTSDQSQKAAAKDESKKFATGLKNQAAAQEASVSQLDAESDEEHEGLWVTLTPTTMSTSPFFDTLLVLVVSPLVTLTVVYALLLLRSRIRRRRWRAPKSVVDRLPIRTYHTMSCTSTTSSTRFASPQSSSPTSPLLQTCPRTVTARSRPRSATASGIGDAVSASLERASAKVSTAQLEKGASLIKPHKKYNGKQVECVVCLEEYVDGESRVMSLPCGHEFHAECITPWLVTRRRTCPICKGDVVRSMTNPPSSTTTSAAHTPYHDNVEDVQAQAAETTNESPSAAIPIPRDTDLERGDDMAATLVNDQPEASTSRSSWRGLTSLSLSAFSGEAGRRQPQANRDR